eukprot:m.107104 g.107104  ORF g.107104 m.107104 type:complete len:395 (+) comp19028_c0_seq1:2-1186(+)
MNFDQRSFVVGLAAGAVGALAIRLLRCHLKNASKEPVFLTARDYEREAERQLPHYIFHYYSFCAGRLLPARTRAAYDRILIQARMLSAFGSVDTATTIFGLQVDSPVIIAPTGFHRLLHADGELGMARAARAENACYVYNYFYSTTAVAEVAAAAGPLKMMQIYIYRDREFVLQAVRDAEAHGFAALLVTCDHNHDRVRDNTVPYFQREGHPAFLGARMVFPNTVQYHASRGRTFDGNTIGELDPTLSWEDIRWLCQQTRLPVVCKGILSVADARQAAQCGAAGLVVSTHGHRQSDALPPAITVLADIVQAVGSSLCVLADSGIQTGTDVFRCLALGAAAVLVGRPVLWGLACRGQPGVEDVLGMYRRELMYDMTTAGCAKISDITRAAVIVQP